MVRRNTPTNIDYYIKVDSLVGNVLQMSGYFPKYMDENYLYFVKSKELIEFMETEGLRCLNM